MSTHTPGPWRVSDTSIVTDEVCVAVLDDGEYSALGEERQANALLLAAGPELLAACARAAHVLAAVDPGEWKDLHAELLADLYHALGQATGRELEVPRG